MINKELLRLMKCFPRSFVNLRSEIIIEKKSNTYFYVNVEQEIELKYKVLEWLSRPASSGIPFKSDKKNEEFRHYVLSGINEFLGTDFNSSEMEKIYVELGNSVYRPLTEEFVASGYDLKILEMEASNE